MQSLCANINICKFTKLCDDELNSILLKIFNILSRSEIYNDKFLIVKEKILELIDDHDLKTLPEVCVNTFKSLYSMWKKNKILIKNVKDQIQKSRKFKMTNYSEFIIEVSRLYDSTLPGYKSIQESDESSINEDVSESMEESFLHYSLSFLYSINTRNNTA